MMTLAHPWNLLALLPLAAVLGYWFFRKPQPGIVLPGLRSVRAAASRRRGNVPFFPAILYVLAALALTLALARPRIGNERLLIRAQGIDMVMVLDLSGSMAAYDPPESIRTEKQLAEAIRNGTLPNRLEVAKKELRQFIEKRPNDRIGLIGFAELGYNLAPPTLDHDWLIHSLSTLEPGVIGDSTGIASPVASGIRRLANSAAPRRVLVLFTDGSNNVRHRLTPLQTAELAREKEVVIYTVGIGGPNAYVLQESPFGSRLFPVRNNFDEKLLQQMASVTGGRYFHAADASGLERAMNEINQLEKTSFEQPRYVEYREFAPVLAGIAALLLVLAAVLENTAFRTLP